MRGRAPGRRPHRDGQPQASHPGAGPSRTTTGLAHDPAGRRDGITTHTTTVGVRPPCPTTAPTSPAQQHAPHDTGKGAGQAAGRPEVTEPSRMRRSAEGNGARIGAATPERRSEVPPGRAVTGQVRTWAGLLARPIEARAPEVKAPGWPQAMSPTRGKSTPCRYVRDHTIPRRPQPVRALNRPDQRK